MEFALVLPVFIMLLFGLITTGMTYNDHLSISNAVREGARLGAAIDYTNGALPTPAVNTAWATTVRDRVKQVYFNAGSTITDAQICVGLYNPDITAPAIASWTGASCGTAPGWPDSMSAGTCVVKVWVAKPAKIQLLVFPDLNLTLSAKSVAYYGRAVSGGTCSAS